MGLVDLPGSTGSGLQVDACDKTQARLSLRREFTSVDSAGPDKSAGYFVDGAYYGKSTDLANEYILTSRSSNFYANRRAHPGVAMLLAAQFPTGQRVVRADQRW